MALNPDFTKMELETAPAQSEAEWKKRLAEEAHRNYDDIVNTTMEHIKVRSLYNHDEYDHMTHLDFASGIPPCQVSRFPLCIIRAPSSVHAHRIEEDRSGVWSRTRGMRVPRMRPTWRHST